VNGKNINGFISVESGFISLGNLIYDYSNGPNYMKDPPFNDRGYVFSPKRRLRYDKDLDWY